MLANESVTILNFMLESIKQTLNFRNAFTVAHSYDISVLLSLLFRSHNIPGVKNDHRLAVREWLHIIKQMHLYAIPFLLLCYKFLTLVFYIRLLLTVQMHVFPYQQNKI